MLTALAALPEDVDVELECLVGDPARVLLGISADVDVIVCGSRGYGPVRSVLLGSVSRRLLDGARCAVIVVPRPVERPLEFLLGSAGGRASS
jgi:nucleotide-binding universal stress UspA family protein